MNEAEHLEVIGILTQSLLQDPPPFSQSNTKVSLVVRTNLYVFYMELIEAITNKKQVTWYTHDPWYREFERRFPDKSHRIWSFIDSPS